MTIGRGGADPGPARGVGEGEAGRALLGNQVKSGADQCLAQIAVVIAAAAWPVILSRPAHVKGFYIRAAPIESRRHRQ
jgi:hypothetical protein